MNTEHLKKVLEKIKSEACGPTGMMLIDNAGIEIRTEDVRVRVGNPGEMTWQNRVVNPALFLGALRAAGSFPVVYQPDIEGRKVRIKSADGNMATETSLIAPENYPKFALPQWMGVEPEPDFEEPHVIMGVQQFTAMIKALSVATQPGTMKDVRKYARTAICLNGEWVVCNARVLLAFPTSSDNLEMFQVHGKTLYRLLKVVLKGRELDFEARRLITHQGEGTLTRLIIDDITIDNYIRRDARWDVAADGKESKNLKELRNIRALYVEPSKDRPNLTFPDAKALKKICDCLPQNGKGEMALNAYGNTKITDRNDGVETTFRLSEDAEGGVLESPVGLSADLLKYALYGSKNVCIGLDGLEKDQTYPVQGDDFVGVIAGMRPYMPAATTVTATTTTTTTEE